jgi:hypothetical protein
MGLLKTISSLWKTRSIENPATPLSAPDDWLLDLAGGTTSSGINVNPQTAMTYAPVYRAVNLISQDVAKLPLVVYRRNGEGKDKATAHPAYRVLRYQTSRSMSAFEFKSTLTPCYTAAATRRSFATRQEQPTSSSHCRQGQPMRSGTATGGTTRR